MSDLGEAASRLAAFSARRPAPVLLVVAALAVLAVLLALRLDASAAGDTLVDRDSDGAVATERFHRRFGGDPVVVLVRGRSDTVRCKPACHLTDLLLTEDLARITALEGCLSGNIPRGAKPLAPVCSEIARRRPVRAVYGPGTFINESVRQVSSRFEVQRRLRSREAAQAARAAREVARARGLGKADQDRLASRARQLVYAQFARDALGLALRYGLSSLPSVNNPEFVLRLVFEPSLGARTPKPRFAYLFPSQRSALIQARLRADLSEAERRQAIDLVREAVASPRFRLARGEYVVSGPPVVEEAVASAVPGALGLVSLAGLVLVAAAVALVSRSRPLLLPLAPALAATALTLGAMALAGTRLTIVTIAVVPITFGAAAAWAIQFQSRRPEAHEASQPAEATGAGADGSAATATAAVLATIAALLAILLSPVPTVRSFAALLMVGVVLALACAVVVGSALMGDRFRQQARELPRRLRLPRLATRRWTAPPARAGARAADTLRKGSEGVARGVTAAARGSLSVAVRHPGRVLAIALAAAIVGWVLGGRTDRVSDLERLASGDLREIEDARALQRETGISGDVNVVVSADDLTSPAVIRWMVGYEKRVLSRHGYSEERRCRQADLCPALSVTNLFGSGGASSPKRIRALLRALPPYFSRSVITPDRHTANIAFGVRDMPVGEQKDLIDDMRAQLDPPAGVRAELAGQAVLDAELHSNLGSTRTTALAALALVFLVLLFTYRPAGRVDRGVEQVIVPLIAIAMAAGWSGLIVYVLQIPLNPLSATLGALVIALCAPFGLVVWDGYRRERAAGVAAQAAVARTYASTGSSLLASSAAAVAGFAALIASDVEMLRDFGVAATVALPVALLGITVVLPATLVVAEEGGLRESVRAFPRRAQRGVPAIARRVAQVGRATARRLRGVVQGRRPRLPGARRRGNAQRP